MNTLYSDFCLGVDSKHVEERMPSPMVLIPRVHLQNIGVENPCRARQAISCVSDSNKAMYQNNMKCHSHEERNSFPNV